MKSRGIILILIALVSIGCNVTSIPFLTTATPLASPVPTLAPTITPLPTPTPSPTPLPEIRIEQADHMLFLGDYDSALSEYQQAFTLAQDSETRPVALLGIGQTNYLMGNYSGAIEALNSIIEVYPEGYHIPETYFYLGRSFFALEDYQQAAVYYAGFLEVYSGVLESYVNELLGDVLMLAGDTNGAVSAFDESIAASVTGDVIEAEIKLGQAYLELDDYENAVRIFMELYQKTDNDFIKAQLNWLAGQAYLAMDVPEQAYARFQDSVQNFPLSYDSYLGLVVLVNAGQSVVDLDRGLVNYFAGQYGLALDAFNRYLKENAEHDGNVHHYMALSFIETGEIELALEQWQLLIDNHSGDRFWVDAWDEYAYTLWAYLGRFEQAAQKYLDFVNRVPTAPEAPTYLYRAARILERNNDLEKAAETWERMIIDYPSEELSQRGLFLAGVIYYRSRDFEKARTSFQRLLVLSSDPETLSGAHLWVGKIWLELGEIESARLEWEIAAQTDPTGYYSERAGELLLGQAPLSINLVYDLDYDLEEEKVFAAAWLRAVFAIPGETDLDNLGLLLDNSHIQLGNEYWEMGLFSLARKEFEIVRKEIIQDPVSNFRLLTHLLELKFYQPAIIISRQILDLAYMDDAGTLEAPIYFNHIRFGTYFDELILPAAIDEGFDPIFVFSVVRQESFFEWFAGSTAGAIGLMQLIPSTGQEMASGLGWPPDFTTEDLYRPNVNITLGTRYLARQRDYFQTNKNRYTTLAAYNAGPGNAEKWYNISGDDPDLFLEVVRFAETRSYIIYISEAMHIYQKIYGSGL